MKKVCAGCGRNRKIGKFARDANRVDGKRIYCRVCISNFNRRYRMSHVGRIRHKQCVDTWKNNNKTAIREYNKAYYRRRKHIILYNKKCKELTESAIIVVNFVDKPKLQTKERERVNIVINPKRKFASKNS